MTDINDENNQEMPKKKNTTENIMKDSDKESHEGFSDISLDVASIFCNALHLYQKNLGYSVRVATNGATQNVLESKKYGIIHLRNMNI